VRAACFLGVMLVAAPSTAALAARLWAGDDSDSRRILMQGCTYCRRRQHGRSTLEHACYDSQGARFQQVLGAGILPGRVAFFPVGFAVVWEAGLQG
jgi:hypothetical protein